MSVELKNFAKMRLAYARQTGPYGPQLSLCWNKIMDWAAKYDLTKNAIMVGISLDNPAETLPENCRYDACIAIPEHINEAEIIAADLSVQTLPSGLYACYKRSVKMHEYIEGYMTLFNWLEQSEYAISGMAFELYEPPYETCNENMPVTFCVQVSKKN